MAQIQAGTSGSVVLDRVGNAGSTTDHGPVLRFIGADGYVGSFVVPYDGTPGGEGFTATGSQPAYSPSGVPGQVPTVTITVSVPDFMPAPSDYPVVLNVYADSPSISTGAAEAPFGFSVWFAQLTITAPGGDPDPDPDPDPVTNFVPQGESRTFPVDSVDLPTLVESSLWEIYRFGLLVDSGTRFDWFGANGWGIEPSPDFATITVTAPIDAAIGEGYDARIRHTGGDFPTVTFIVTPATIPPAEDSSAMPHFLFSTGTLLVSLPLPAPTLERRLVGAPAASALPLANLLDDSMATLADLPQTDAGNYQYLIADLGSIQTVGRVIAGNVVLAGGGTLLAYVSNTKIITGNFGTATALTPGTNAIGNDREFIPLAGAASVSGRYVYLVPSGGTGVTVGDIDLRSEEWTIGTLQNAGIDFSFQHKELRPGASVNLFPVADAQYDGAVALSCESAEFDARSINAFTGAMVSAALSDPQTITGSTTTRPKLFVAEYRSQDTLQRPFRAMLYACRAPGFTWSLKRDDFASNNWTAALYLPDATARAWRLYLGQ
ncbi:MAG: hypothetical protein V4671_04270 [Armatimonadota bacterium]